MYIEPLISYMKSCWTLWKQGNTSIVGRGNSKVHYHALIVVTPEVLTSEVSSIFYLSCLSFKHIGLWDSVLPPTAMYMMIFS